VQNYEEAIISICFVGSLCKLIIGMQTCKYQSLEQIHSLTISFYMEKKTSLLWMVMVTTMINKFIQNLNSVNANYKKSL
jgi:hypothetical protein